MDWLDQTSPVPGGGRAASGGRFYHLSFRSGSRASGACARASHDYIAREGEYANGDRDPAIHSESDHMPLWAVDNPRDYWNAADLHERANGRLPCTIRLVRAPKPSMGFYDFDEYERLLDVAKDLGPTAHLVVLLGGEAGLRCGEMIGLEWGDVDLIKRQMCVQRAERRGHVTVPKGAVCGTSR